jgi:putative DNA primase/helicase
MTGPLDKDGFCIGCGEVADWCQCGTGEADPEPIDADGDSALAVLKAEVARAAKDDQPAVAVRILTEMVGNGLDPADRASARKWIISKRLITAAEFDRITTRRAVAQADRTTADPLPDEPLTELGYAHRLVALHGNRLRYVPEWRRWLTWDGARWAHDTSGQAARWMKSIARRVTADAIADGDDDRLRAALRGESSSAVAGALALAGTEPELAVSPGQLDADPYLLNVANGTLDLRDMTLRDHDPADLLTKVTRAPWHPDAASPEWDAFLVRVQPGEDMRRYLARLTGLSLEGQVTEHLLPVHYGAGANGKTTYIDAVVFVLGDYAAPADPNLLTARTWDAHPTGCADLFGLRLAVLHETDRGGQLAEATVKRLTGGDPIKARRMREDFWSFLPSHTFAMLTNHRPVISGTDDGIWRRVRLVPWEVQIPAEEQDGRLGERLRLADSAILRFLVDGYAQWQAGGLDDPEQVVKATDAWRGESDALARFIEQRCITGPHFYVQSGDLFAAWSKWCAAEGEEHGTQTAFSLALARGFGKSKDGYGRMQWKGIALAGDDDA